MGVGIAGGRNLIGDGLKLDRREKVVSGTRISAETAVMTMRKAKPHGHKSLFYEGYYAWVLSRCMRVCVGVIS